MAVDQKYVLDPVDERVLEHDLGEGCSGTPGFPAPLQSAPRQTVLEQLVERLERRIDRLCDRRHDQRMEDVDEGTGVPADRAPQGGCQDLPKALIARRRLGDCRGENATDGDRQLFGIVQHLTEMPRQLDLTPKQQGTQLLEAGIKGDDPRRLCAGVGIDIPGQLEQRPGQHLAVNAGTVRGGRKQPLERDGGRGHLTLRFCCQINREADRRPRSWPCPWNPGPG